MSVHSSRIPGYDLARALAVLGMVLVNFTAMMEVGALLPAWLKPLVDFIYGRAAVVFVMLAGVSVSLMAGGCASPEAVRALQRRLLKRSLLLLISGLVLWRWWEADILHFYAVFIAAGAWAMTLRDAPLRILAAVVFCISLPVCATLTSAFDLGDPIFTVNPARADLVLLLDYLISPYYALFPWIGFFLTGMLLGRLEPLGPALLRRLFLTGTTACLVLEIFSATLMGWVGRTGFEIEGHWWITFLRSEAFPVTPLFVLSAGASAAALIGLCRMAAGHPFCQAYWMRALTSMGRLSLTLYVAHIGWGLLFKRLAVAPGMGAGYREALLAAATFGVAGLVFTIGWCRYFQRGPLEIIFYRFTHGKARLVSPAQPATSFFPSQPK